MTLARTREVKAGKVTVGGEKPLVLIAGPCVIESEDLVMHTAQSLKELSVKLGLPLIFKSSFDKANRTAFDSFRGPGMEAGLEILARVRREFEVPVLSDIHQPEQAEAAAGVLDVIQVPAFLCRQTDLLLAAGKAGRTVNLKKGQFMAPEDMARSAEKVESAGNKSVMITERGSSFGYHNLVADMRSLAIIREAGYPVVFDATHSVQLPSARGGSSGGERRFTPLLARAAAAAGVDALFMEVHPDPETALCDGPNSMPLSLLEELLKTVMELDRLVK